METLDRGSALSSQFKDLLRKPVESTRPSVYNQRPQPNRLAAGSRTNSPKGVDEDRSGPGWRVYGSRLRSPEQRVSTPPGITRPGSEWDPSYGFLSPQLGTRNQAQQRRWNQSNIPRNVNSATRNAPVTAKNGSPFARNSPLNIPGSKQSVLASKSEEVSSRNGSICSGKSVVSSGNPVISTRNAIYGRNVSSSGWNSPTGFRERSERFQSQDRTPLSSGTSAWNTRQPVPGLHGPANIYLQTKEIKQENTYQSINSSNSPARRSNLQSSLSRRPDLESSSRSSSLTSGRFTPSRTILPVNKDYTSPIRSGSTLTRDYSSLSKDYSSLKSDYTSDTRDYLTPIKLKPNQGLETPNKKVYSSPDRYEIVSPHKYEDISNPSYSSPTKFERVESIDNLDFSKSESYEFIQSSAAEEKLRNKLEAEDSVDSSSGAERAERADQLSRARNYIGSRNGVLETNPETKCLENNVVLRQRNQGRSRDLYRRSCDLNLQDNIYAEPRYGLTKRSATQLEINRNQQDPLDKRAEIGKLGNSGTEFGKLGNHLNPTRIPRVAESRIPRLQNTGQRSDNLNSVGERSEDSSNSDPLNLTLKKGMLWSQRKRLFSRWKEKYFILTPDYLHCFKKGGSKISEMGAFDYKVRLADIERIELEDRKGYYTINLHLKGEESILLRRVEASRDWYTAIHQAANTSRERRKEMLSAREFWSKKQFTDTESIQSYVQTRYRGVSETPSSHLYRRGMSPSSGYSPSSTPSPSPRLNSISPNPLSPRIISPSPLLSSSVISPHLHHHYPSPNLAHQHQHYFSPQLNNYSAHLNNYSTHLINSPPTIEQDSGIDSLLTSLSDTSSNYSHRRIISPR